MRADTSCKGKVDGRAMCTVGHVTARRRPMSHARTEPGLVVRFLRPDAVRGGGGSDLQHPECEGRCRKERCKSRLFQEKLKSQLRAKYPNYDSSPSTVVLVVHALLDMWRIRLEPQSLAFDEGLRTARY